MSSNSETKDQSQNVILRGIDKIYNAVVDGSVPGTDSAAELAQSYLEKYDNQRDAANALDRWQNTKAAVDGAVTGLGGVVTMLATLPVNVASVLFIQVRMVAAIAYIGGVRDFKDDRLQTMVKCCLLGESVTSVARKAGVEIVQKVAVKKLLPMITGKMLTKINQAVGFRLVTKFGSKGIINIGKGIPFLGAIVGAAFDGVTTNMVGNAAIETFIE